MKRVRRIVAAAAALTGISGCRHTVQPASAPAVHALPVNTRALSALSPTAANATSLAAGLTVIHSNKEYIAAERDCKHHDYRNAAVRLTALSKTSGYSHEQRLFCLTQANICRKDAGTPEIVNTTKSPSSANISRHTASLVCVERSHISGLQDCGPRALQIAAERLGVRANVVALTAAAGTDASGTSMQGLIKAAMSIGLDAEGVQTSREALAAQSLPAIAWYKGNHFVVVTSFSGKGDAAEAKIRDPNQDHDETISQEALLRRSSGYLLLLKCKQ